LPTDHGWKLPDEVWAIPPIERHEWAKFNADLCELGERLFMRCILKLPFTQQPEYYGWGIWIEVSERDFLRDDLATGTLLSFLKQAVLKR